MQTTQSRLVVINPGAQRPIAFLHSSSRHRSDPVQVRRSYGSRETECPLDRALDKVELDHVCYDWYRAHTNQDDADGLYAVWGFLDRVNELYVYVQTLCVHWRADWP